MTYLDPKYQALYPTLIIVLGSIEQSTLEGWIPGTRSAAPSSMSLPVRYRRMSETTARQNDGRPAIGQISHGSIHEAGSMRTLEPELEGYECLDEWRPNRKEARAETHEN